MATCPVCDMSVDEKTAPKADYQGRTFYFCSEECKTEFQQQPEKYANATTRR